MQTELRVCEYKYSIYKNIQCGKKDGDGYEIRVRGQSISLKVVPLARLDMVSY